MYDLHKNDFTNISSEFLELYLRHMVFETNNMVDLNKTYSKYLKSFKYEDNVYFYEQITNKCLETHGTHVASICSGNTNNIYTGVAPDSTIIDLCVQSSIIESGLFFIQDSLRWVSVFGKSHNISIVNMSLGSKKPWGDTNNIINNIISQGIYIVAATGNSQQSESHDDQQYISYPSGYPDVISIGSLGLLVNGYIDYSQHSKFSECGNNIDFAAPGRNIIGASSNTKNEHVILSGTSMACPYASGIICLLLSYFKKQNIHVPHPYSKHLNYLLSKMVIKITDDYFNNSTGFGCIDVNFKKLYDVSDIIHKTFNKTPENWKKEQIRN